jgi:hypothetical protein
MVSILAQYDLFQLENRIKPDYANAGGVEVFWDSGKGGEWVTWHSDDGYDFEEWWEEKKDDAGNVFD